MEHFNQFASRYSYDSNQYTPQNVSIDYGIIQLYDFTLFFSQAYYEPTQPSTLIF